MLYPEKMSPNQLNPDIRGDGVSHNSTYFGLTETLKQGKWKVFIKY